MAEEAQVMRDLFIQRERDFLLGRSAITMRSSVENLELGDHKIELLREGEKTELPRWIAEELVQMKLAEMAEEPFETEIFRSLSREKMMGPLQLSGLSEDFYLKMKRRLSYLNAAVRDGKGKKEEYERLRAVSYDMIGMRLNKLLSLSSSLTTLASIGDKLTAEEKAFFTLSQSLSKEWKEALLGGEAT